MVRGLAIAVTAVLSINPWAEIIKTAAAGSYPAEKTLRERLIGAWSLASYEERPVGGSTSFHPMSKTPKGIIMYSADGFMSAQLSQPGPQAFRLRRLVQGCRRRIQE